MIHHSYEHDKELNGWVASPRNRQPLLEITDTPPGKRRTFALP